MKRQSVEYSRLGNFIAAGFVFGLIFGMGCAWLGFRDVLDAIYTFLQQ